MTTMNPDMEMINLERRIGDAVAVATRHGYPALPAEYHTRKAVAQAAARLRDTPHPPLGDPPGKAEAVPEWAAEKARGRLHARETQAVADELHDTANRQALRAAYDEVPGIAAHLSKVFAKAADAYAQHADAPRQINAHTSSTGLEQHQKLLAAADQLTLIALDRARLAPLTGEVEDLASQPIWLILDPAGHATIGQVLALLEEYPGHLPTDVAGWDSAATIGPLRMAAPGTIPDRKQRFAELTWASGMAPDGGRIDKTLDQAAALVGTAGPSRAVTGPAVLRYG